MPFKETIINMVVVLGVFGVMGYVIIMKVRKNNPKAATWLSQFKLGSIYKKVEPEPIMDKMEQVYDDKRTLM